MNSPKGLAGGLISKVRIGIHWRLFIVWQAFDWFGYYGLSCLAALKILKHSAPHVRTAWGRCGDRTSRMLHVIEPIGKPLFEVTHNPSIGGFMKVSSLILIALLVGCASKPPVTNVLNYYAPPKQPIEQTSLKGPIWNCQPWQTMDSTGNCLDGNNP